MSSSAEDPAIHGAEPLNAHAREGMLIMMHGQDGQEADSPPGRAPPGAQAPGQAGIELQVRPGGAGAMGADAAGAAPAGGAVRAAADPTLSLSLPQVAGDTRGLASPLQAAVARVIARMVTSGELAPGPAAAAAAARAPPAVGATPMEVDALGADGSAGAGVAGAAGAGVVGATGADAAGAAGAVIPLHAHARAVRQG